MISSHEGVDLFNLLYFQPNSSWQDKKKVGLMYYWRRIQIVPPVSLFWHAVLSQITSAGEKADFVLAELDRSSLSSCLSLPEVSKMPSSNSPPSCRSHSSSSCAHLVALLPGVFEITSTRARVITAEVAASVLTRAFWMDEHFKGYNDRVHEALA